jgi:hypothetical protein
MLPDKVLHSYMTGIPVVKKAPDSPAGRSLRYLVSLVGKMLEEGKI